MNEREGTSSKVTFRETSQVNKPNLKSFFFDSFKALTEDFIICQALSLGYSNKQDKCKQKDPARKDLQAR